MLLAVLSGVENIFVHAYPFTSQGVQALVLASSAWVVIKRETRDVFHYTLVIGFLVLVLLSFALHWNQQLQP